jgi:multiple sugar transport system permease protein
MAFYIEDVTVAPPTVMTEPANPRDAAMTDARLPVLPPSARGDWIKWGFVGPTLLFLIALNVFPLLYNLVLSFTDASLLSPTRHFVGGRNFARIFTDPVYAQAIRTTGKFVFFAVSIELVLGFVLALALKRAFRGKTVVLTILLIPMMLSPAVMGLFWNLILDAQNGILNQALGAIGLPQPRWRTDPNLQLASLVLIDVWMWTPFMMLIAMAGLNAIPNYIYEAAEIDRASAWTVFRRITLPMCAPLLLLAVLLRTTDALKQFDLVMAVTGPNDRSTQTLSALLYKQMIQNQQIGVGSAYAVLVLVIVIALATVFTRYLDSIGKRQGKM